MAIDLVATTTTVGDERYIVTIKTQEQTEEMVMLVENAK